MKTCAHKLGNREETDQLLETRTHSPNRKESRHLLPRGPSVPLTTPVVFRHLREVAVSSAEDAEAQRGSRSPTVGPRAGARGRVWVRRPREGGLPSARAPFLFTPSVPPGSLQGAPPHAPPGAVPPPGRHPAAGGPPPRAARLREDAARARRRRGELRGRRLRLLRLFCSSLLSSWSTRTRPGTFSGGLVLPSLALHLFGAALRETLVLQCVRWFGRHSLAGSE